MPNKTTIEWTDYTSNPIVPKEGGWGCSKVSFGCDSCYAERINKRMGNKRDFSGKWEFVLKERELEGLLKLKGHQRIFMMDMGDLFHSDVPWDFIGKVFDVMIACPQHQFQVLTKRPGRMTYFAEHILPKMPDSLACGPWPPNVWAGTSVESQKYAPRLDCLLKVPAKVRFISAEPLLGPLNLSGYFHKCSGCGERPCACKGLAIRQVIVGGESGPGARPMDLAWARDLVGQCQAVGTACFVKQLGARPYKREPLYDWMGAPAGFRDDRLFLNDRKGGKMEEWPEDLRVREFPNA